MLVLTFASQAQASADEDFRRGQTAYQRGDFASAMHTLRAPAKAGHGPSQTLLAYILEQADFAEEAARLYESASAQGDPDAHAGLANLYLTGRGIAKDEKKALAHFSKAAERGHAGAALVLAEVHLKGLWGLGAEVRDDSRTLAVLNRAAELGHLPSAEALARAHREGGWGLHPDAAMAATWQARIAELRRQRAGAAPAKARP
jgi:TPR repeat protein